MSTTTVRERKLEICANANSMMQTDSQFGLGVHNCADGPSNREQTQSHVLQPGSQALSSLKQTIFHRLQGLVGAKRRRKIQNHRVDSLFRISSSLRTTGSIFSGRHFLALCWIAINLVCLPAQAWIFSPASSFSQSGRQSDSGLLGMGRDESLFAIDLRLLRTLEGNQILFGGMHKVERGNSSLGEMEGFSLGPSVGFDGGSWIVVLTWHVWSERKYSLGGIESRLSRGEGPQLDAAWISEILPGVGFGPQVTYRKIRWHQARIGSSVEAPARTELYEFSPVLALSFRF